MIVFDGTAPPERLVGENASLRRTQQHNEHHTMLPRPARVPA
ncbi:hypothetical protein [Streptomyces sp. UNOC14_S4]|nr:hypothetical protein [Streptomyces sp. UNOC14_S4]